MKVDWLNRDLMVGPYMTLVLSDAEFGAALKHCKLPRDGTEWIKTAHADATVHWADHPSGGIVCIVAIRPKPTTTGIQIASLLVHEAVHIFQKYCDHIGEDSPSSEFEAYSIQRIAQSLMESYAERAT